MQMKLSPPIGLCQCGCGKRTSVATQTRRGNRKGDPLKYAPGHHMRGERGKRVLFPVIDGKKICTKCREAKRVSEFGLRPDSASGHLHSVCRPCRNIALRRRHLRSKWGFSLEEWERRFDAQGRVCAICGTDKPDGRGWHVDHDHACCAGWKCCGKCVRGILCSSCNVGLGTFNDSPERLRLAARYLEGA